MKKFLIHATTGLTVTFEEDEGGWYICEVPLLPGCISQGHGFSDAARNISSAIEDYLEILREDSQQVAELPSVSGGAGSVIDPSASSGDAIPL